MNYEQREFLRKACAACRDEIDLRTDADRNYLLEQREPELADLISTHSVHVAPYGAIVYARIGEREVGVKYSATGGDKAEAVRLAVREVLRLVGVVS